MTPHTTRRPLLRGLALLGIALLTLTAIAAQQRAEAPTPTPTRAERLAALADRPAARYHLPPEAGEGLAPAGLRGDAPPELRAHWARGRAGEAPALAHERELLSAAAVQASGPVTAAVLVLPVEFAGEETLRYEMHNEDGSACVPVTDTFRGPLHGEIPYPGGDPASSIDNQTVYYPSTEAEDYARLVFGREGYTRPLRAGDPNVGDGEGVDISGLTVQSYFDAQSDGRVVITGTVAPWVQSPHSEAYYGIDTCIPDVSPRAIPDEQLGSLAELAVSAAEALKAGGGEAATYDYWRDLDRDHDGFVDTLWIVHAGRGQEYGGGAQGEMAIWSRASDISAYADYEGGHVIHDNGTPAPEDDIRLGTFTILPEDSDLGVLVEEFGHAYFGLPDLYTINSSNSVGWWAPMSAGIWGGELGGTRPVNMPLWFRMVADCGGEPCGWADPVKTWALDHEDEDGEIVVLGQAGEPAGGLVEEGPFAGERIHEGLRIDLPEQVERLENRAGIGGGAYSGAENGRQLLMTRALDLSAHEAPLTMTLAAHWNIVTYWGYAYVEISTDGETFESIPDLDGHFTDDNPFGLNEGYGTTGAYEGEIRFDLSEHAGEQIWLRLRHFTYQGTPGTGFWVDDLALEDEGLDGPRRTTVDDFEQGLEAWDSEGWMAVPLERRHPHHYLVEWRNAKGFDEALTQAYSTSYRDQDEWRVDRVSANVPGAVVMYRNLKYPFSGGFTGNAQDPPSIGSKYALLVVDTDFWPVKRPSGEPFPGRLQSLDGSLALQRQPDYTLELRDPETKALLGTEAMTGGGGARVLDDAHGYYPGFFTDAEGQVRPWDEDASVVLPSRDDRTYSTRITHADRSRPHPLDGASAGGAQYYGSGAPGDANAAMGLHIELLDQAEDGSWGALRVFASAVDYRLRAAPDGGELRPGGLTTVTFSAESHSALGASLAYTLQLPAGLELASGQAQGRIELAGAEGTDLDFGLRAAAGTPAGAPPALIEMQVHDGDDLWTRRLALSWARPIYLPWTGRDAGLDVSGITGEIEQEVDVGSVESIEDAKAVSESESRGG